MHAQEYADIRLASPSRRNEWQRTEETASDGAAVSTKSDGYIPHLVVVRSLCRSGPHRFLVGVLKGVHCDNPALDLTVDSAES